MKSTTAARAALVLALVSGTAGCGGGGGGDDLPDARGALRVPVGGELVITTDHGVTLRPGAGGEVAVDDRAGHRWSRRDDTRVLDLDCAGRDGRCPRMPRVDVPDGVSVTVRARDAGIDAAGIAGALDLTTVNGDITVTGSGADDGAVRLATRNGSVRADALRAGKVRAGTVNGDVTLACATAPAGVGGTTVDGSVRLALPADVPAYRVRAATDNGSTSVDVPTTHDTAGRTIRLTTVDGDVTAARA
ncbi:DUF4097 family beta strand repeat protein [Streptomyces sp. ISL-12]|uniref:DUF4097 family beta strand repeat-containing protein n=1 Tax=Streptomyces sp. ISL-12 TaxID=2819177 RepID=UPI001BE9329A|nr:DUF4097 family beta strand repeat-containing protein [Streptomyces sp. ISL-12]MBT2411271.1 DUF4097 family beta strand repeat protein [Streptomyces sp. ISL-12]